MFHPRWHRPLRLLPLAAALAVCAPNVGDSGSAASAADPAPAETGPACADALGLYASLDCETLRAGIQRFTPQYALWSDGVAKTRFVYLPPGESIDTSDPDAWVYPVGTKLWKRFETDDGVRLETRVVEKVDDLKGEVGWTFETYAWNEAGDAVEGLTRGRRDVLGTDHDIPEVDACAECHSGGANQHESRLSQADLLDLPLGFGAIALNHTDSETTLASLSADGWLSHDLALEDAVVPGDETARDALGYLHVNCGSCHGGGEPAKDMTLAVPVGHSRVEDTPTYQQTVGHPTDDDSRRSGIEDMPPVRITPGDPSQSAIVWRMRQRDRTDAQMPPLATDVVHDAGVAAVSAWIEEL